MGLRDASASKNIVAKQMDTSWGTRQGYWYWFWYWYWYWYWF